MPGPQDWGSHLYRGLALYSLDWFSVSTIVRTKVITNLNLITHTDVECEANSLGSQKVTATEFKSPAAIFCYFPSTLLNVTTFNIFLGLLSEAWQFFLHCRWNAIQHEVSNNTSYIYQLRMKIHLWRKSNENPQVGSCKHSRCWKLPVTCRTGYNSRLVLSTHVMGIMLGFKLTCIRFSSNFSSILL